MTRIIGGSAGGRRLRTPSGSSTRPTTDRVREAVFSKLEAWGMLREARVLDLYAGSGALGLEAASRGAAAVDLVESARGVTEVIRQNAAQLDLGNVQVSTQRVETFVAQTPRAAYDVVFLDPPYPVADVALAHVLGGLSAPGWLAPSSVVVVERSSRSPEPPWPDGWRRIDEGTYGETRIWYAESTDVVED